MCRKYSLYGGAFRKKRHQIKVVGIYLEIEYAHLFNSASKEGEYMHHKRLLLSFVVLVVCIISATLSGAVHAAFAQRSFTLNVQDWNIPAGQDPWGTAFDSSGHVWVAIPGCDPTPICNSNTPPGIIAEFDPATSNWIANYQLPSKFAQPLFLAFGAMGKGNLWFPMPMNNSLGMFNPTKHTFQQWAVPTASAGPWDVAIDHQGLVWFTEHYTNKISSFDPVHHVFKEYATSAQNSQPYGIVVDAHNNIWFTENNSSVAQIGEFTASGVMHEYKIRNNPPSGLTPHLITIDSNGNIWWSEGFVGMIGELKVSQAKPGTNNGVTEYAYPVSCGTCGSHTSGISVDKNGMIWFDDSLQNIFGSFPDTGTGSFTTYNAPTQNGHPHDGLQVDSQNRIWFDEEFANKLAEAH